MKLKKIKYILGLICWGVFLFLSLWHGDKMYSQLFASLGIFSCLIALSASPSNWMDNSTNKRHSDL
jgi:hypothetical protein